MVGKFWKIVSWLLILWIGVFFGETWGDDFSIIPSIEVKEEYNDNIYYTAKDKEQKKDRILTSIVGISLKENTERLTLGLSARLEDKESYEGYEVGSTDEFYKLNINCNLSPRLRLYGGMSYNEDSRNDREYETTGEVSGYDSRRVKKYTHKYNVSVNYFLNEKLSSFVSYSYDSDAFSDNYTSAFENDIQSVIWGITYDVSTLIPKTVLQLNSGFDKYEYQGQFNYLETSIDSYSWTIGFTREFTEKISFNGQLGQRYTNSEYEHPLSIETIKNDETGLVGTFGINASGTYTTNSFSVSQNIIDVSDSESVVDRRSFSYDFIWRLMSDLRLGVRAGYFISKSDTGVTNEINEKSYNIRTWSKYTIFDDYFIEMSYSRRFHKDSVDNTEIDRNIAYIRLGGQWDL